LYYKFYCGVKTTDKLLTEIIKPLTEELQTKQLIDQFFFIRYTDPDLHIRLRFHIINTANIGKIISIVNQHIQHFLTEGLITKMQTDTYKREIERYGNNSIAMAESFFHVDSIVTLNLLDLIEGENGEQIRWQFAIRSIDELLTNFNYTPNEKLLLLEQLKTGFIHEHSEAKELKVQLDVKFRNVRKQVEDILDRDKDGERNILPLIELLAWKAEELAPIIKQLLELKDKNLLQLPINELMASYIHMMLNRIFKARQRTYEMLLYDLLYRFYKTTLAKEKSKEKDKIMSEL
jgi:thiopeptide-type bacteriocin biosynthesis protein